MPNRRHFLRGLGGVCLALPSFESLQGTEFKASKAKRFVCVSPNYGMHPSGFFPEKTGDDYVMPKLLKPLEKHRSDFSVFNNLDHPGIGGGHGCSNTFLNGMELRDTKDQPQRLHSLDQLLSEKIGQRTRFPSLRLGAGGVSWSRAGIILPTEGSPSKIFAKLFLEDTPKVKASQRKFLDEDGSILDAVYADAKRLGARMAKIDQAKLDEYLTAVRDVERKLQRQATWIDVPKPQASSKVIEGNNELVVDLNYPYNTPVMYDLMVMALQTQSSNVITFGHPGGNRLFPFEGVELGYHSLTHHGKRPDLLRQLTIIELYYIRHFARFLDRMKATKDADGRSLLESTVILFGSGMGNASSHSSRNLPILLSGGGFKTGQHHRFERIGRDGRPLCDLFVSILQRLGVETDRFSTSKGNLNHLIA